MAPKNKQKGAFYFFMKDVQQKEARKGRSISMTQMPNYAHPIWKKMSVAEKEPFEELARQYKNDPNLRGGRLASDGTRIEDNLLEEQEKARLINKMKQDVKRFCNSDCTIKEQFLELAPKKLLYFMTFNLLCKTEKDEYIPIEIGIVEYSIEYGIHRQYTKIICPGLPPTGYAGIAKKISEATHDINVFGEDCGEKRLGVVYDEIKSFISPTGNDEYPPLFCKRSALPITIGCLDWLCKSLRRENVFEVWDATYLLMELAAGVGKAIISENIAEDLLSKTSFDYHPSTRCDFHEEKDNHHCALTYSKKLCYLLSDVICSCFHIDLTEQHIPARAQEEKAYTITIAKDPRPRSDLNPVGFNRTNNYSENARSEEVRKIPKATVPRQPASTCLAAEMNKLNLDISVATIPGHGIGRGIRRKE